MLSQNDSNQVVSLASFSKFCASAFGVELAQTTAHDYLHALGFSSKVSQVKTSGFTIDVDALAKMMFFSGVAEVTTKAELRLPLVALEPSHLVAQPLVLLAQPLILLQQRISLPK